MYIFQMSIKKEIQKNNMVIPDKTKCKLTEHLYIPITWHSYQSGEKAIQEAKTLICEKCLDVRYIEEVIISAQNTTKGKN